MNSTLTYLNARRAWLVRDFNVWGSLHAEVLDALATEVDDSETRVAFTQFALVGQSQEIAYSSLIDHRGNTLPASIDTPVVIPIVKNDVPAAIIGQPGPTSFRLAKTTSTPEDALIDLWIIEAGS